jgi:hypothetical protein
MSLTRREKYSAAAALTRFGRSSMIIALSFSSYAFGVASMRARFERRGIDSVSGNV